jgi:ferredoxin-type protein NapG
MERRDFFRLGAQKTAEIAFRLASETAARRAANWLRPPFAGDELDFQLACTRCDKCIEACPHDVLFKLPARLGIQAAGTPAMDLLNRGCHLCQDWPCVAACEPDALTLPDQGEDGAPARAKLARVEIDHGPECGACAHACPVPGALEWQDGVRPVINQESCTGCALCREACIVDPKAITVSTLVPDEETSEVP